MLLFFFAFACNLTTIEIAGNQVWDPASRVLLEAER